MTGTKHGVAQFRGGATKFPIVQVAVKAIPQLLAAGTDDPEKDKKWLETALANNPQVRDESVLCDSAVCCPTRLFCLVLLDCYVLCYSTGIGTM
jgi:hypothetical protein